MKSPLDDAILAYRRIDSGGHQKIDEIPFDFIRKRISIVVSDSPGRNLLQKVPPRRYSGSAHLLKHGETLKH